MTTIRVATRQRWTTVNRTTINDARLSFRARGVLVWLLDKPDDWQCSAEQIALEGAEGRDAIRSVLGELEKCGYLVRNKHRGSDGQWHTEHTIYEVPPERETSAGPERETSAGEPPSDSQASEQMTVTDNCTRTPVVPAATPTYDCFDDFWRAYPRKVGKPNALAAYRRMVKRHWRADPDIEATIREGLRAWWAYWQARNEPEFVPHPATWLNQERWNDAPPPISVRPAGNRDVLTDDGPVRPHVSLLDDMRRARNGVRPPVVEATARD